MSEPRRYEGERLTVVYDPGLCIHEGACVRGLPAVFDTDRRPWVDPAAAPPARIAEVVMRCPSGALRFERPDGGPEEPTPSRNMINVSADGPLHVRGELEIETPEGIVPRTRATLCRCGASKTKPFCDGSHREAGFAHDGGFELGTPIPPPATQEDGPLRIRPSRRGPLLLDGIVEVRSADLETWARLHHPALCRCGHSGLKPFCDGTHHDVGFGE
jgi:CDGSH-type Zn-finger protein/uncharacterized Fe-S cluster protein YjdI